LKLESATWVLLCSYPATASPNYRYEEADLQKICNWLCKVGGIEKYIKVHIKGEVPAQVSGTQIHVSQNAVDSVSSMGDDADDAFAALLGHELAHILAAQHSQIKCFVGESGCKGVNSECDMDFYGLLLAHLGGFTRATKVWDGLLARLDIRNNTAERKIQDQQTGQRIKTALDPFELGNYLLVHAGSDAALIAAIQCYETCRYNIQHQANGQRNATNLRIRQIDYQIGLAWFQQALLLSGIQCRFPVEVTDPSFLTLRGKNPPLNNKAETALAEAQKYLEASCATDRNWPDAHIALACVELVRSHITSNNAPYNDLMAQLRSHNPETDFPWFPEMSNQAFRMAITRIDEIKQQLAQSNECPAEAAGSGVGFECPLLSNFEELKVSLSTVPEESWGGDLFVKQKNEGKYVLWFIRNGYNQWGLVEDTSLDQQLPARYELSSGNFGGPYRVVTNKDKNKQSCILHYADNKGRRGSKTWIFKQ
jgi:ribosomal protein S13